ncbi:Glycosyltransferase, CAZy family GT4 [Balamuthia mandrillaris]
MAACHLSSSVLLLLCLLCCYALLCEGNSSQERTATTEKTPRLNQALHVLPEVRVKEEGKVTLGEEEEEDDSLFDVSIVIPTSGARKWTLHRCLNSLLSHLPLAAPLQGVSFGLPSSSPARPHGEGKRVSWEVILVPTIHNEAEQEEEEGQQQQREGLSITPHLVRDSSRRRNILSALRDNEFTSASFIGEKQRAKDRLPPFQTFYYVPKGNHFTEEGGKPATTKEPWLSATLQKILSAPPTTKQAETMEQLSGVVPKEALLLRMYNGKPASNSSHALNLGALLARGRYLLFLEENMAVANKRYGADPLRSMLAAFHSSTSSSLTHMKEEGGEKGVAVGAVGIVGSKVIYAESDDGAIYHAGIDFMLSPHPKDKTKNDDNLWQTWNHDSEGKENQDNVPMPYHRLQGYSAHDGRVARKMSVLAVSKAGMMLPRQLFYSLNGFALQHFGEQYMDVDLCLRLRAKLYQRSNDISVSMQFPPSSFVLPAPAYPSELPLAVVYEPNALFLYHEEGEEVNNRRAAIAEEGPEAVAFAKLWSESEQTNEQEKSVITQLWQSEIYDNYAIRGTSLYWNAECGAGEVMGFTTEAIHFMLALEKMIPLHYETSNFDSCKNDLVRLGFPVATQVILSRLERKSTMSSDEATNDKFLVLHRDPGRYHISISTGRLQKPDYIIGRSMFETNNIPSSWRDPANNIVNEIWVPSTFNLQTFASGGVHPEKLHQMPEPVDTFLFDPLSVVSSLKAKEEDGFILPVTAGDDRPEFRFFSMFKWETRKGWKTLFEAYLEEFEREKNVALYILTRMKSHHKEQYARFLDEFMINHRKDDLSQSPKIVILSEMIPTTKLPSVFATMDCFVLATHGEGWGLPLIESMAMELPVIATNWSGNTEFMTEQNSYLISVEELVPQGQPDNEGHLWALPSKQSLKQHMRHVFSLYSSSLLPQESKLLQANQKRKRARSDVLNNYSLEKVGQQVIERLRAIKSDEARFEEVKRANEERRREASSPNTANNWNIWNGWNNNDDAALTPLDEGWRRIKINSG